MFYAVTMYKCKISEKRRHEQITHDISRKGYVMEITSLATNNPKQGTTTSCEERSLEDKDGSWSIVTS